MALCGYSHCFLKNHVTGKITGIEVPLSCFIGTFVGALFETEGRR